MDTVFLKILNMSITASYVILAVLLVRLCLRLLFPEVPKKYSYLLWLVVAFRLICPWSFDSQLSLFRWEVFDMTQVQQVGSAELEYIPSDITTSKDAQVSVGIPAVNEALQDVGQGVIDSVTPGEPPITAVGPEFGRQICVWVGIILWCIGMIALAGYGLLSYLRLKRRMEKAILLEGNVFQSEQVRSPFILGVFCPRIYIPFDLKEEDLRYVLSHERTHLKRRDHMVKPLAYLLLVIHWFNPLVWVAFYGMSKDMELSCDEVVLSQGENIRKAYSSTLLYLSVNQKHFIYSPLAFGETSVKTRIKNALKWKTPKLATTIGAGIVCILVIALCAFNPLKPTPEAEPFGKYYEQYVDDAELGAGVIYFPSHLLEEAGEGYLNILGTEKMFHLTEEHELLIKGLEPTTGDPTSWVILGTMEEIHLTKANFSDYFYYNGGSRPSGWINAGSGFFPQQADYYRHNNWKAWRLIVEDRMYYLLQQRDGAVYMAYGYYDSEGETDPASDDSNMFYLLRIAEGDVVSLEQELEELSDLYQKAGYFQLAEEEETQTEQEIPVEQESAYQPYDNDLDNAIAQAVLEHNHSMYTDERFACESHVILKTEYVSGTSRNDFLQGEDKQQIIVYLLVMYNEFVVTDGKLELQTGNHVPTILTFDVGANTSYQLAEYWEPRDGEDYASDVLYSFPADIREEVDTQKYVLQQTQSCYEQAVRGLKLDGEAIVERLLDEYMFTLIASSTSADSHRMGIGSEMEIDNPAQREITYYGDYTLSYIFKEFLKGGQTDFRGDVMRILMVRTDEYAGSIDYAAKNGQDYFDEWLEAVHGEMERMGADFMKQRRPAAWLALQLAGLTE